MIDSNDAEFRHLCQGMQSKWFTNLEFFLCWFSSNFCWETENDNFNSYFFLNKHSFCNSFEISYQGRPNVILWKEYTVLYVYESLSVQKYLCTKTTTLMITFRTQSKMIFFSWVEKRYTAHEVWPNGGLFLKFSRFLFRGQAAIMTVWNWVALRFLKLSCAFCNFIVLLLIRLSTSFTDKVDYNFIGVFKTMIRII